MNPSAHSVALSTLVEKMWPTPRAANPGSRPKGNGGKILEEEVLIAEGLRERGRVLGATMWRTPSSHEPGISPERLIPIEGGEVLYTDL